MEENILFKFESNNKLYFAENKNNKIVYYFLDDDKKVYNLSREEIDVCNSILNRIAPSNQVIKLMDYKLNNKKYEIFYDAKILCLINNQEESVYSYDLRYRNNKTFKRLIKVGKVAYIVLISTALLSTASLLNTYAYQKEQTSTYYEEVSTAINNSSLLEDSTISDKIRTAIASNGFLNDKEKEYMYQVIDVILDNKQYSDVDYIERLYRTVQIEYKENISNDTIKMTGSYNPRTNIITFYDVNNIEEVDIDVFNHELCHTITFFDDYSFNSFLIETTNSIFNEEYLGKEDSLYCHYYNYTKILMEIIGSEPLKRYHGFASTSIITNALKSIINDEDRAVKLVENLDAYKKLFEDYWNNKKDEEIKDNLDDIESYIIEELKEYYEAAKGISYEDDVLMQHYFKSPNIYASIKEHYKPEDNIVITGTQVEKQYFNKTDDNVLSVLMLDSNDETQRVWYKAYITEDTRYYGEPNEISNNVNK